MEVKILLGTILRHVLTLGGGTLAAKGIIDPSDVVGLVEAIAGAVITVGTLAYSYYTRKKALK